MERYGIDTYGEAIAGDYDRRHPELHLGTGTTAEAVDALAAQAALAGGGPALELGIGTGRVALPLAERGLEVHGVDASAAMLDRLRDKPGADRLVLAQGDATDPPLAGPYGLIFVVFNTLFMFGDQEDQIRVVTSVAERLRPGGRFAVECFVPDLARDDRGQRVQVGEIATDAVDLELSRHDPVGQRIDGQHLRWTAEGGISVVPFVLRYLWPSEMDLMARLVGLRLVARTATWAGDPFGADAAAHISIYERPTT